MYGRLIIAVWRMVGDRLVMGDTRTTYDQCMMIDSCSKIDALGDWLVHRLSDRLIDFD